MPVRRPGGIIGPGDDERVNGGAALCGAILFALTPVASDAQSRCSPQAFMRTSDKVRPAVKTELDRVRESSLKGPAHTTDSLSPADGPAVQLSKPANPKPFPAGNYRSVFSDRGKSFAVWVDTERRLGHYATVVPGASDLQGTVQLSPDADATPPTGPILNDEEIDYLLGAVYAKFCSPLDAETADQLNRLKDMLLAVRFSGKRGAMMRFHRRLLSQMQ